MKGIMGRAACMAAVAVLSNCVHAQDAKALQVRTLAATCANCHGSDGHPPKGSALPALAGVPADHFKALMAAFKAGTPGTTVMHQIAKGFTDAQIEQMAAYFAAQSRQ